jgi:hypothetical protein
MTYLQLINKVLVGLREDVAIGIADHHSKLIGQFVNEAKEEIEDMGPWYALRTTLTGSTAASTSTIDFTATTNERSYILDDMDTGRPLVWITTSGKESLLTEITSEQMEDLYNQDATQDTAQPNYFSWTISASGITMKLWPLPDAVYTVKARAVVPQAELSATTDVLTIAATPVWKLALHKAMDERGSEMAGSPQTSLMKAQKAIEDYYQRDWGRRPLTFSEQ